MQLRFATDLSADDYVRQEAWKQATLQDCPLHMEGGCGFAKHGTYERKHPEGARIARFYCRLGGMTFSLLPDCLASRLTGSLCEVEAVVTQAEVSPSQAAAADRLRPHIELPGAIRWISRRVLLLRAALTILMEICPLFSGCEPTILSFRSVLGFQSILQSLRARAVAHLHLLPPPLGFGPHPRKPRKAYFQHKTGTDPPTGSGYDCSQSQ